METHIEYWDGSDISKRSRNRVVELSGGLSDIPFVTLSNFN